MTIKELAQKGIDKIRLPDWRRGKYMKLHLTKREEDRDILYARRAWIFEQGTDGSKLKSCKQAYIAGNEDSSWRPYESQTEEENG